MSALEMSADACPIGNQVQLAGCVDVSTEMGAMPTQLLDWGIRQIKVVPGVAPGCGRGLFALAPIAAGEIVDRACTAFVNKEQCLSLDAMLPVGDFYFQHPLDKDEGLMVFGMPSLVNHSETPNAHIRFEDGGACGWIAVLYALRDIAQGEELTYRYRCPVWFEAVRIA